MLRIILSIGFLQVIGIVLNMVRSKIFALLLGPAGFGVVATIDQLVVSVSQFANLSLPFTAMKFLSRDHSRGEERFGQSFSGFLKVITVLALLATGIAAAVLPGNLANLDPQLARFREPVLIALLGVPATMLLVFFVNVLAARQLSVQSILLTTLSSVLMLVFGVLGCWLDGISGVYYATVPAGTALMIGLVLYARVKMKLPVFGRSTNIFAELRTNSAILETAIFTYVAVGCYSVQLLVSRYVSISHLGEEAAGLLQAGLAIALSIGAVLGPANSLYLAPYLNRDIPVKAKIEAANSFLPRLILLYCLGALPVMLFPDAALRLLFSSRFAGAVAVLSWFVVWQCLAQIANVYQQLLIGLDDVKTGCIIISLGHLLAIALSVWLIDPLGLVGVAVAFIASAVFIACLSAARLHSKYRLEVSRATPILVVSSVLGLLGVAMLSRMTGEMTLLGLGARLLTALVFLAGLWIALPASLRSELSAGLRAKLKPWRRLAV